MNTREKRMVVFLVVILGLAVVAGAYMLIYDPWMSKKEQIAKLKKEIAEKTDKQDSYRRLANQYNGFKAKSLTADPALARRGYDFLLNDLLTKAGISSSNFTVSVKPEGNKGTIPVLNLDGAPSSNTSSAKDKLAYQKVVSEIKLVRVDLRMLGEFLRLYYNAQVLQHISSFKIATKNEAGGAVRRIRTDKTDPDQWNDLDVTMTTEAIILDGADSTKTLVAIPEANAAGAGGALFASLTSRPEMGSQILIAQAMAKPNASISSVNSREYAMLMGKDIFHGPLPPPPEKKGGDIAPPPPPKPNIDRFIKLNEITRRSDGSAKIEIRDQFNNFAYTTEMTPKGEKTVFKCVRTWFSPSGKPIHEQLGTELTFADDKTASQYKFKVVAIDTVDGIVLSGPAIGKPASGSSPAGGGAGGRNFGGGSRGGPTSSRLAPPKANAALAGGWVASLPEAAEKLYYLKNGTSIEKMRLLNASEVVEIIKRNTTQGLNPYVNSDIALPAVEPVAGLNGVEDEEK